MINEVVEAYKASDQLFADLEEKWMKIEEAQQEREAKMCRDDQIHIIIKPLSSCLHLAFSLPKVFSTTM